MIFMFRTVVIFIRSLSFVFVHFLEQAPPRRALIQDLECTAPLVVDTICPEVAWSVPPALSSDGNSFSSPRLRSSEEKL